MSIFVVVLNQDAPEPFEGKIRELYPLSYRYADNIFFLEKPSENSIFFI